MPPRHNYWTIIFANQPTSFRTATREELLPTFKQIQSRHPDAVMMWFAHGRLWKSEDEAREARFRKRHERPGAPRRPFGPGQASPSGSRPPGGDGARVKDRWRNRPAGGRPTGPADRRPPAGNRRPETGDRPPSPASRRPDTGDRRPPMTPKPRGDGARGREWRPGGTHKDPRDRFKVPRDVKRARFKQTAWRDRSHPKPAPPRKKKDEE